MREWLEVVHRKLEQEAADEASLNAGRENEASVARRALEVFVRMANSSHCRELWSGLERRCGQASPDALSRMHREFQERVTYVSSPPPLGTYCLSRLQLRLTSRAEWEPAEIACRDKVDIAFGLAMKVAYICEERMPTQTRGVRRAKLRQVEQAVQRLEDLLSPVWSSSMGMHGLLQDKAIDRFVVTHIDAWLSGIESLRMVKLDEESVAIAHQAGKEVVREPFALLDALLEDVREWANEEPEIGQPNNKNAERLFLIRRLTEYFCVISGDPLRPYVRGIVMALCDDCAVLERQSRGASCEGCDKLTDGAIAMLAPVAGAQTTTFNKTV